MVARELRACHRACHRGVVLCVTADGEAITKGNTLDTAPEWIGCLRWDCRFSDTLCEEFDLNWADDYFTNADIGREHEGHVMLNWRGDCQATPACRVFVRMMNVLNERYDDRGDFAYGNDWYFIAMPRQVYAGIDFHFFDV